MHQKHVIMYIFSKILVICYHGLHFSSKLVIPKRRPQLLLAFFKQQHRILANFREPFGLLRSTENSSQAGHVHLAAVHRYRE